MNCIFRYNCVQLFNAEDSITQVVNKDKQRKVVEDKINLIDSLLEHSKNLENKFCFERMMAGTVLSTIGCISAITMGLKGYSVGKIKSLAEHNIHIDINDIQITEDLHMILCHCMMKVLGKCN